MNGLVSLQEIFADPLGIFISIREKQHKNGEAKHTCFLRCVYNRIIQKQKIRKYSCLFPVSEEKRFFAMAFPFPMCRSPRCILWQTKKRMFFRQSDL